MAEQPPSKRMKATPGKQLNEGKTKIIYELPNYEVLLQSKDRISAHNAQRVNELAGKAAISNATAAKVFEFLNLIGIKTHFVRQESETAFVGRRCEMIPIEWVTRRVATGSFLKRNPGVNEGYRFAPPKLEYFYKDDAAGDPEWSYAQLIEAKMTHGGRLIGAHEVDIMGRMTVAIFEVLEKAWAALDCTLIDMKIEFGVDAETGEILLADIIDSDSWRLWPAGDKRLMVDKQVYRDLKEVTDDALQQVKRNFEWVAKKLNDFIPNPKAQVVVLMGSASDLPHGEKIKNECTSFGIHCDIRVTSAHKGTEETLNILKYYESLGIPAVFIAVAGRSNGLGPVLSGNATFPVINCPPVKADWGAQDIWSSLRLPSGLGCTTTLSPEGAAWQAAQILGMTNHVVWGRIRARQLNTWIGLKESDKKLQDSLA
ncbi:multifunctional protein ADE2-like isoform X1 [Lytechinus variegatus]|uniref:multifunctional protein ADE2-like isoform X1 n=1 Tax=Lytechinus variegatus TaxID=7654 RepID=UPI001BB18575|nr:multifunctional protein ADE2-like isoform X1 [Lytechinus variegatus]XP_041459611.1 multifunctional protein ADE2-like isoform X1 [Lytechinus variegatus]